MPRVIFTISYGIKPESREEYLALSKEMKEHFTKVGKKDYSVFEVKGKKNQFMEMFVTSSMEEYDTLEDNQDEASSALVKRLEDLIDGDGMKYTTLIEVE